MYSVVLATLLTAGTQTPELCFGGCRGCFSSCGGCYSSCNGCYGGCYGGGCYGGGCYGGGCYGGGCYGGCYGGGCYGGYGGGYASYGSGSWCYGSQCYGCSGNWIGCSCACWTGGYGGGSYGGYGFYGLGHPAYYGCYTWGGHGCYGCSSASVSGCAGWDCAYSGTMGYTTYPVPTITQPIVPGTPEVKPEVKPGDPEQLPDPTKPGMVMIKAPLDVEIKVNGHLVDRTAAEQNFSSPPLKVGATYEYVFTAGMVVDGETTTRTKTVTVRAGQQSEVDFSQVGTGRARVTIRVPEDAKLFVDDVPAPLDSSERSFTTPNLERGKEYYYEFKATVVRDGRTHEKTKRVSVKADGEVTVDFNGELPAVQTASR